MIHIKTLNKLGIGGINLKIISTIYEKTTAKIMRDIYEKNYSQDHTEWAKTGSIPFAIWHSTRMPSLTTPIQYSTGSSSQSNQARKRNKVFK